MIENEIVGEDDDLAACRGFIDQPACHAPDPSMVKAGDRVIEDDTAAATSALECTDRYAQRRIRADLSFFRKKL
ncbi:hypothetical protein ABC974_25170 [Sphingomonas oligophenolica]|uniref:Uncharacterized protein n=1 Tax=Sphingomonas oligophenolica TaxID=301154 RepID=A0ABU9YAV1_9SPHN